MNTTMTQHDQISAYIDGELSMEQEQDFLISLASSDNLRKSFRSELVLKNVIHRDEVLTTPSRNMRGAVLSTLGISAAATLASQTADAATSIAPAAKGVVLKTFFASKVSALLTASVVTLSAIGGYGIHSVLSDRSSKPVITAPIQKANDSRIQGAPEVTAPAATPTQDQSHASAPKRISATHKNVVKQVQPQNTEPSGTISGSAPARANPPIMESIPK